MAKPNILDNRSVPTNTEAVEAYASGPTEERFEELVRVVHQNGGLSEYAARSFCEIVKGIIDDTGKAPGSDTLKLIFAPVRYKDIGVQRYLATRQGDTESS